MNFHRIILLLLFPLLGISFASSQDEGGLSVMSFNVRYENPGDGENAWTSRRGDVTTFLQNYSPDIIGLQEVLENQLADIQDRLPGYAYTGVGRDDGKMKGEYSPIFYRTERFSLVRQETFWLSQTEDTASVGWDAALPRICTYAVLASRSGGDTLHVFNTHFDHEGRVARQMSAELLQLKIRERAINGQPVIVMGDLNAPPTSTPVQFLKRNLTDPDDAVGLWKGDPIGTFNGWLADVPAKQRIDYVLYRGLTAVKYRHLADKRDNGLFLSDHYAVLVTFE